MKKRILITGGAGFIGSHLVRRFVEKYSDYHIYNLDLLTYAGNLENLKDIERSKNYTFIKGDITDQNFINKIFEKYKFDSVIPNDMSEPDVLIRTSGEQRLSNFCMWHLRYTELIFIRPLFPECDDTVWDECLEEYSTRKRRYGK